MSESAGRPRQPSSSRSSALVGAGIFLSRVFGLGRQTLIAMYLGAGPVADAFNGAFRVTNIIQNLFGEGALSASFIPVYVKAVERGDQQEADRVASAVASILALTCAIMVGVGIAATPIAVKFIVGGYEAEKLALTIRLTRILFPGAGIFVMGAWCLGILNSHRRFFLSYAAPVFWNIAMIAALLVYGPRRGEVDLSVALAWASVVGAALLFSVQLPTVLGLVHHFRPRIDHTYPPVREVVRNFLPAFVTRGAVQLSGYVDIYLASSLPDGLVTLIANAQNIYLLPISLFGMAVSAAELPELSRDSGTDADAYARLRARLNTALPRVAFFVVPSAVGFLVLGEAISGVLLQHGKFGATASHRTWAILAGSAFGLVASALGRLYSSTFFALRDTRTPLAFAIARVVLTGGLGYLFAFPLPRLLGLPAWTGGAGLTLSAGIAGWFEFLLLRRAVTRRIGATGIPLGNLARLWAAAGLSGVGGWLVMRSMDPGHQTVRSIVALVTFALVYGTVTLALGVPEAKGIVGRVTRR
ncbi:MAG: murein biosynthesis integral membrane protein MurJ [bacterium]